jgi:hypothetical protein
MSRKNRSTRFTHELEVGTEVVYDQVQGQAVWSLAIELLEKHQPLGVPKSLLPVSDHNAERLLIRLLPAGTPQAATVRPPEV